jgi:predicted nucleic acid-binding protein
MLLLMRPDVGTPIDPNTGRPVEHAEARISALVESLEKQKDKIILPTPALSELLERAGDDTQSLVNIIQRSPVFRIAPFDTLAAIEVAAMTCQAVNDGDKRGGVTCSWTKVKYDRQIIAIAKVHRATKIYSDDEHIRTYAEAAKIQVIKLADLPIPQAKRQGVLDLKKQENTADSSENSPENEGNQKEENDDRKVGTAKRSLEF